LSAFGKKKTLITFLKEIKVFYSALTESKTLNLPIAIKYFKKLKCLILSLRITNTPQQFKAELEGNRI